MNADRDREDRIKAMKIAAVAGMTEQEFAAWLLRYLGKLGVRHGEEADKKGRRGTRQKGGDDRADDPAAKD